ncbi:MAG: response regulator transcription factor [Firmicutes bacterium]|nr:response regulator transcription factor [Bacillota bacterium]
MKIKIGIICGDENWMKWLADFLKKQGDMIIAGTAMSKEAGIQLAHTGLIDIFLVDVNLPENKYDGIFCTAEISQFSKAKVIMVSSLEDEAVILHAFSAGAVNYILKDNYLDIPKAIRSVYYRVSPLEVLARNFAGQMVERLLQVLTPSEKEVFDDISRRYKLPPFKKHYKAISTLKCQEIIN